MLDDDALVAIVAATLLVAATTLLVAAATCCPRAAGASGRQTSAEDRALAMPQSILADYHSGMRLPAGKDNFSPQTRADQRRSSPKITSLTTNLQQLWT